MFFYFLFFFLSAACFTDQTIVRGPSSSPPPTPLSTSSVFFYSSFRSVSFSARKINFFLGNYYLVRFFFLKVTLKLCLIRVKGCG